MAHDNPYSPLAMTAVAIPAYATQMTAMAQLGSMCQHGNSIGAAFILLVFGAGMNLGLLTWMIIHYGWKKAGIWMSIMLTVVLILSYGIERPLYPQDIEPANHTHAFDIYCQPLHSSTPPPGGFPAEIWGRIGMETQLHEFVGAGFLMGLIALGLGLRLLDRKWVVEDWLNREQLATGQPRKLKWDVVVPGPVRAGVGFLMIVAGSIVGCFAYYPAPDEAFEELRLANTEGLCAALRGDRPNALHWIPVSENWLCRLQVGTYLRHQRLTDFHRMTAKICRDKLELLEHMVQDGETPDEIRKHVSETSIAFSRLRNTYVGR